MTVNLHTIILKRIVYNYVFLFTCFTRDHELKVQVRKVKNTTYVHTIQMGYILEIIQDNVNIFI